MRAYLFLFLLVGGAMPAMAQGPSPVGLQQRAAVATPGERRDAMAVFQQASVAPTQWKKGALIGGIVGAGLGLVLLHIIQGIGDSGTSPGAVGTLAFMGGTGLIGALFGGMIGSFSHK